MRTFVMSTVLATVLAGSAGFAHAATSEPGALKVESKDRTAVLIESNQGTAPSTSVQGQTSTQGQTWYPGQTWNQGQTGTTAPQAGADTRAACPPPGQ